MPANSPLPTKALSLALLAQLASQLLYFFGSATGMATEEELHTASASVMMLNGFTSSWVNLQLMSFCGGCSVDAVLALPMFAMAGPALILWKLVPWGFSALTLVFGAILANRLSGAHTARLFMAWMVFAPSYYLYNAMYGFSNHTQVMALVFIGMVVWLQAIERDTLRRSALCGLVWGLSFWYCYTSAFAPPVMLAVWAVLRPREVFGRKGLAVLGGSLIGLLPWIWTAWVFEGITFKRQALTSWIGFDNFVVRIHHLGAPYFYSIFAPAFDGDHPVPGLCVALLQLGGVIGCAILAVRAWRTRRSRPLELALPAMVILFVLMYLAVQPGLKTWPLDRTAQHPFRLRYLTPLVPLTGLCIFHVVVTLHKNGARLLPVVMTLGTIGVGMTARMTEIQPDRWTLRPLSLNAMQYSTISRHVETDQLETITDFRAYLDSRSGIARRVVLKNLGMKYVNHHLLLDGPTKTLPQARFWRVLDDDELRALSMGIAEALNRAEQRSRDGMLTPVVEQFFEEISPEFGCQIRFQMARVRHDSRDTQVIVRQPIQLPEAMAGYCEPYISDRIFGQQIVAHVASLHNRKMGSVDRFALAADLIQAAPSARRYALAEGAGEMAGTAWGYDADALDAFTALLPAPTHQHFQAGFSRGARWAYLWPARQTSDQPQGSR